MRSLGFLKATAVSLSCCGLLFPQMNLLADGPTRPIKKQRAADGPAVIDVAMGTGSIVTGEVLNLQKKALTGVAVSIRQNGREVASAVTDENGAFAVKKLRGGLYHVIAADGHGFFRFWTPNSAPPTARGKVMIVSGAVVIRAQNQNDNSGDNNAPDDVLYDENGVPYGRVRIVDLSAVDPAAAGPGFVGGLDIFTLGILGAAFTGLGIAIYNNSEVRNLRSDIRSLPKTP